MWRSRRNWTWSLKHHTCSSAGIQLKKPTSCRSLGVGSSGLNLGSLNPPRWPKRTSKDGRSDRISTQDCPLIGYFSRYRRSSPLNVRESISTFLKPGEFKSNGIFFTPVPALGGRHNRCSTRGPCSRKSTFCVRRATSSRGAILSFLVWHLSRNNTSLMLELWM
jgi:hypothetical protein